MKTKRKDMTKMALRDSMTMFDEMERAFQTMMNPGWMYPFRSLWPEGMGMEHMLASMPKVDVIERESEILVRAEVPGIDKKDLHIELAGNLLTIKGEHEHKEETKEEGTFHRSEIKRGSFIRTIRLPSEVALDETNAEFKDGVLEILLQKALKTEKRRIDVK